VIAGPVLAVATQLDRIVDNAQGHAKRDIDLSVSIGVRVVVVVILARAILVFDLGRDDLRRKRRSEAELREGVVGFCQGVALELDSLAERVVRVLFLASFIEVERNELLRLTLLEPIDVAADVRKLREILLTFSAELLQPRENLVVDRRPDSPIGRNSSTDGSTMSEMTPFSWVDDPSGK